MNKILKLPPETARKIAAGEVIERPQSVIRELLDNAIDAHAARIEVTIEQGGIEYIQVADNGDGIEAADLPLAIEPHATSKITQIDDLLTLHTLGFRGEALASIAAVAELEIVSALEHGKGARLYSTPATEAHVEPYGASKGTTVTVRNLFANFPARKKFLKYPHAESLACRQTFIEKAIPFPEIELQFTTETAKLTLP
ncbi:MAG TPA: DNA mismatch repair endonuclease MutL, partial [Spirochaetales bacterium]|nr:DNA mismatch repair endonuclease MutL [Spirochaetales bacterium]